jgi:shikimate kinase
MHISTSAYHPIFLIGYSGVGKTYWGKLWSELSGLTFYDLDDMVEEQNEKTISEIFASDGEEHFRNLETAALRTFVNSKNVIVATGGGTPCFNNNISWMNKTGVTVYLQSSAVNILKRLEGEKEKRPLIKDRKEEELLFYISEKIKERETFYKQATIILNIDDLPQNYLPGFLKI